jgi:DNA-binding CsgD family transcriptional regulator
MTERVATITVDGSITSAAEFWYQFALAAGNGESDEHDQASPIDGREFDWKDGHRLMSSGGRPLTVIMDCSNHDLPPAATDDLARLLRLVPTLRLIVASRRTGWAEVLDPDRRLNMTTLTERALRFTTQEIRSAALLHRLTASDGRVTAIEEDTAGWPFGVDAVLRTETATGATARSGREVHDLVLRRLRNSTNADTHLVDVLTICMVGQSDGSTMSALGITPSHWRSTSDTLAHQGLGWWNEKEHPLFHVTPLVQRSAQRELRSSFPEAFRTAQSRLSGHLLARANPRAAFRAALDAEDWSRAESILKRHYIEVSPRATTGGPVLADRGFSARKHPFLVLFAGIEQYARGKHITAARLIATAVAVSEAQRLTEHGRPSVDRVWMQGILLIGLRLAGVYQLVPRALDRFLDLLRRADDPDGDLAAIDLVVGTQTATTFLYLGDAAAARAMLSATVHWADDDETTKYTLHWLSVRAFAEVMDGQDTTAFETLRQIDAVPLAAQITRSFYAVLAHTAAAILALQRYDLPLAESELQLTAEHWATMEHWPLVLHTRVMLAWKRDGPGVALALLDTVIAEKRERAGISPFLTAELRALRIDLLLADFRTEDARAIVEHERGSTFSAVEVARLRYLVLTGQSHEALASARSLLKDSALGRHHRPALLLIAASAALRVRDEPTARRFVDDALVIATATGRTDPFAFMIRQDFIALRPTASSILDAVMAQPAYFSVAEPAVALTRRENIVLERLASDLTLAEIAVALNVSVNTVRNQTASIYRKLGVARRDEAVDRARQAHLL